MSFARLCLSRRWRAAVVVSLALIVGVVGLSAEMLLADVTAPRQSDRQVALAVTALMRRLHLTQRAPDDEISADWLDNFVDALDPMKLYFYQSDLDEFRERKFDLDNMINRGDISFAHQVFNRYLRRVDEKVQMAEWALDQDHDFTVDEEIVRDPEGTTFPKSVSEARDRWRKRIKHDILVLKTDDSDKHEDLKERLTRRYESFGRRMHQTSDDELLEMYLTAMTTAYDPHTSYMSPETLDNFNIIMGLKLQGIGATLRFEDGYTIVTDIVPGGAADRDGRLHPEDRVIGVGQGKDGKIEDVVEMKLSDVVNRIRGQKDTIVRLQVIPAGKGEPTIYDITRDEVELTSQEARAEVVEFGTKRDGTPYKFGVINLPSFYMDMAGARANLADYKSTTRDVQRLLDEKLKPAGIDAVVLDLRRNGGGALTEAINLTGLFIDTGPVVQIKDPTGGVKVSSDTDRGTAWDGPLVVLTSRLSASASEILAAAVQDYNRGLIIGDPSTHGKGTVQSLLPIGEMLLMGANPPRLGALKVTQQQFYRPAGPSTQKKGVEADVVLPSVISHMVEGEKDLDHAIEFDTVPAADYKPVGFVDDTMRRQLQVLSAQRVEQNPEFQKVKTRIEKFLIRKDSKTITLNEEKYLALKKEMEAENEIVEDESFSKDKPVVEKDFYFNEALQVTLDYLMMQHVARR